jgi:hypothetical protein
MTIAYALSLLPSESRNKVDTRKPLFTLFLSTTLFPFCQYPCLVFYDDTNYYLLDEYNISVPLVCPNNN